jgi:hypothetical protein
MRWALIVARMEEKRSAYRIWRANLNERDHMKDLGVDGAIILKLILNIQLGKI